MYSSKKEFERKRKAILIIAFFAVFIAFLLVLAPERVQKVDVSPRDPGKAAPGGTTVVKTDEEPAEPVSSSPRNSAIPSGKERRPPAAENKASGEDEPAPAGPVIPRFQDESGITFTFRDTIKENDAMYKILVGYGVSPRQVIEVDRAARPVYDLRRIKKGQILECELDRHGELTGFKFKVSPESLLVVTPGDEYSAELKWTPLKVEELPLSLNIRTSLWEAVTETDEHPALALKIAEIFQWQVDFLVDIREGDNICLLVEKLYDDTGYLGFGKVLAAEFRGECGDFEAFHFADPDGSSGYYDSEGVAVRKMFLKSPLNYTRVSSGFSSSRMHPILRRRMPHYGVDYAAPSGSPISASADGKVVFAGRKGPNGRMVEIRHNSVYSTYYLHLSRFARGVKRGAKVEQGQVIGYVGSTGRSTGPHLDYRMTRHGSYVNPLRVTSPSGKPVKDEYMALFRERVDTLLTRLPIDSSRVAGPFPAAHTRVTEDG